MNWGDAIFMLLSLAGVFVLLIVVKVLKSEKKSDEKIAPRKDDQ
jgi:hypothetical protein